MVIVSISTILAFGTILSIVEIPKMLKKKQYKEVYTFAIVLALGMVLAILKILGKEIANPSDLIAWVYLPIEDFIKNLF
jgi:hypothetical protein